MEFLAAFHMNLFRLISFTKIDFLLLLAHAIFS